MKTSDILEIGGIRFILGDKISGDYIKSPEDAAKVSRLIGDQLVRYRLDMMLLKIHDDLLNKRYPQYPSFAFISITKSVLLNCTMYGELTFIHDEEFLELLRITTEYETFEPTFSEEMKGNPRKALASYLLRTMGKQSQWDRNTRHMLSRTLFIYEELIKDASAPKYIREIITTKFEERFGVSLHEFIKIGAILWAGSAVRTGGLRRDYLDKARSMGMPVPDDAKVRSCLNLIACDPDQFKNDVLLKKYNLNPLLRYPLIRLWNDSGKDDPFDDKFIAPFPDLLIQRITIGLYYQLYNIFGEKFSTHFGDLFELYVSKIIEEFRLPYTILSEKDIDRYIPVKGNKGTKVRRPDWIIFAEKGIILIECKATHYTQDMYEHGIDAKNMGCLNQIRKALDQFTNFEPLIPLLCEKINKHYKTLEIKRVIISLEPLMGLKGGPIKEYIDGQHKRDWVLIPVEDLEEIQHHIAKGYDFWSFISEYKTISYQDIGKIRDKMESETEANESDNMFYSYRTKIFDELLEKAKKIDG